ncbi:maleylpyruvate isomerase family mycothiol-dependent enzyme [Kribbella italica]|uniref:Uncharacterized protein (TIGR03083 family) n=1 Tax=Kribbella italica TaxID=1540520 RepID=A0A7W9J7B3_9ACTN|nr:maleylpyruvate isomerase family mycothiol-dependent enzyme [Kribbella italica]MBB5836470.1 uncharacterized protein (TIGR03083 family) [Kribbella italica]
MSELSDLIRTERLAFADLLATLSPDELATPSLCGAWTVQEVGAHLASASGLEVRALLGQLVRSGFRLNHASAELAKQWSRRGPEEIVRQLRENAETGARPAGVPEVAALVDAVVHAIDVRRPLGKPRDVPPEVFTLVADFSAGLRWPMNVSVGGNARKRLAGVRLVAEGYDWAYGEGPEVRSTGEAALRMLNGRPVERAELSGPGADLLASRLH